MGSHLPLVRGNLIYWVCLSNYTFHVEGEGLERNFRNILHIFPQLKKKRNKGINQDPSGKGAKFSVSAFRFPGPPWSLLNPSRLQVVKSERVGIWSEDILTTPIYKEPPFNRDHLCLGVSHVPPCFSFSSISLEFIEVWVGRDLKKKRFGFGLQGTLKNHLSI